MAKKFSLPALAVLAALVLLSSSGLQQVRGQIRSRSEVFGDVVEYMQTLTDDIFAAHPNWPETLKTDLEDVTNQLSGWKDTREDIPASQGSPTFLMHR